MSGLLTLLCASSLTRGVQALREDGGQPCSSSDVCAVHGQKESLLELIQARTAADAVHGKENSDVELKQVTTGADGVPDSFDPQMMNATPGSFAEAHKRLVCPYKSGCCIKAKEDRPEGLGKYYWTSFTKWISQGFARWPVYCPLMDGEIIFAESWNAVNSIYNATFSVEGSLTKEADWRNFKAEPLTGKYSSYRCREVILSGLPRPAQPSPACMNRFHHWGPRTYAHVEITQSKTQRKTGGSGCSLLAHYNQDMSLSDAVLAKLGNQLPLQKYVHECYKVCNALELKDSPCEKMVM